ncbi:receptor-type tyrosine-protein phosphatase alpha-like isoform X2 [Haliotis rubra]|uniref:receptor-type tyrosine-protein phosphatase alpha-like isoform X2 n=1 Tax=Haliotis rubra TaxID=36100 RepID=UPI001EE5D8AD|nr:receptor-type tyrosine-protein phosphatase alpha-like isoform X2 [Haliotis rubra]
MKAPFFMLHIGLACLTYTSSTAVNTSSVTSSMMSSGLTYTSSTAVNTSSVTSSMVSSDITYASSTAVMMSSVTSSMMSSEGSVSPSATEKTLPASQAMVTFSDFALPEPSATTYAAKSADYTHMASVELTSASVVPLTALASSASSILGTSSAADRPPEQTVKDSPTLSPDVMTNSRASTPTILTSTAALTSSADLPPSALSTNVVTAMLRISATIPQSTSALSTVVPANVSMEDETTVLISFLSLTSTLSTTVPTAASSTEDVTTTPRSDVTTATSTTTTTFIPPVAISSKPVSTATLNPASLTAIAPSSTPDSEASTIASRAAPTTFTFSAVLTPESKTYLSDSVLIPTWIMKPSQAAASSSIASASPTTTSKPITPGSSSTFTISTLMTSQPVTQDLPDSTEGLIDDTHLPATAGASTSATSLSSSLLPSETSSSLESTAESTSLAPSATSSSLASTENSTLMVPSGTSSLTSKGSSPTLEPSVTSSSLSSTGSSPTLEPSVTSSLTSTGSSPTLEPSVTSSSLSSTAESTSSLTTTDSLSIFNSMLPTISAAHTTSALTQTASTLSSLVPTSASAAASTFLPSASFPPSTGTMLPSESTSVTTDTTPPPAPTTTPPLSAQTSPTPATSASPLEQTGSGDTYVIVGVSIGVLILLAVVVSLLVVVKLRVINVRPLYDRMGIKRRRRSSNTTIEMTLVEVAAEHSDIEISGLGKYIASKMKNRALDEEYKTLPSGPVDHIYKHAGQLPCNKMKNRFADIFAYDCSRVVLQRGDSSDSDYINANFITGYNHKQRAYIAAQGPNVQSLDDFWLMIWQQDVRCIVMLTNLRENNKRKCEKYWPNEGSRERYGDVDVSCTCEDVMSTYVVRFLQTSLHTVTKTKETRRIVQYHFTTWPDHGVPSAPSLVQFWQQVKDETSSNRPLLVHCSAGVGRTGTFIGLDALMERCKVESTVNVFSFVSSMRGERISTVQTRRQYTFLHLVLLEALYSEGTHRLSDELVAGIRCEEEHICEEFQRIQELAELNRNPAEEDTEADVKEVSYVPSYTSDVEFLVTSSLPGDAATHVWSVVDEYKATLVIAICDDIATGVIPSPMGETMLDDTLLLTLKSSSSISAHVLQTDIIAALDDGSHSDEEDQPWVVTLFSTPSVTDSISDVLTLVEKLENTRNMAAESIIVYSCPDSHPAVLLCTIVNVIQRLQRHSGVDIYLAVREMQSVIPSYHVSQDDYRFLYKLASQYVTSTNIYANAYV